MCNARDSIMVKIENCKYGDFVRTEKDADMIYIFQGFSDDKVRYKLADFYDLSGDVFLPAGTMLHFEIERY